MAGEMIPTLAACLALVPAPTAATPVMEAAWVEWQAQRRIECIAEWQFSEVGVHAFKVTEPVRETVTRSVAPKRQKRPVPASVEAWRPLVAQYGWDADEALRVISCESRGDPNAYNPSSASGLFQVKPRYWAETGEDPFDPADNVRMGWRAYVAGGYSWRMWVCRP